MHQEYTLYDEFLFKDLFHFGLNRHIKSLFHKSLFTEGVFNGSLRGLMDCALLYAGYSFTVGFAEEERNTASLTKMADAPECTHKMAATATGHIITAIQESGKITASHCEPNQVTADLPEPHNRPAKPESAHVVPAKPGSALVVPAKPGSALVMPAKPGSALVVPAKPGSALVMPAKPGSALVVPAKPESALVVPAKPGSVLVMPAKPGPARVMSATPESPAKMATTPADAPLWPGLIACVLDAPLVSVRAAGIPRAAALTVPESLHVSADLPESLHVSADLPESSTCKNAQYLLLCPYYVHMSTKPKSHKTMGDGDGWPG